MNNRLQQFLAAENLSQAQFAEVIGVARASVSHIIAGRNKPGFDFIDGMISHFPNLNIEWLITGKGKMYRTAPGLFTPEDTRPIVQEPVVTETELTETEEESPIQFKEEIQYETVKATAGKRKIAKVIVFYDDNTFQELG